MRRLFLYTWLVVVLSVLGAALLLGGYAYLIEPRWLRVRRRLLFLENWDPALDGLTILHLSDLHIGLGPSPVERFLGRAREIAADLVVITGDFVAVPEAAGRCSRVLGPLTEHRRVFAVPGNHDHAVYGKSVPTKRKFKLKRRIDSGAVVRALEESGLTMLVNRSATFPCNGTQVTLVGIDDMFNDAADLDRALSGVDSMRSVVLLSHSPDILGEASALGIPLALSGHTHGGQVRLPPFGTPTTATRVPLERPSGPIRKGRTVMHISPGLGLSFPPIRFFARPEATVLELRAAAVSEAPRDG